MKQVQHRTDTQFSKNAYKTTLYHKNGQVTEKVMLFKNQSLLSSVFQLNPPTNSLLYHSRGGERGRESYSSA